MLELSILFIGLCPGSIFNIFLRNLYDMKGKEVIFYLSLRFLQSTITSELFQFQPVKSLALTLTNLSYFLTLKLPPQSQYF